MCVSSLPSRFTAGLDEKRCEQGFARRVRAANVTLAEPFGFADFPAGYGFSAA